MDGYRALQGSVPVGMRCRKKLCVKLSWTSVPSKAIEDMAKPSFFDAQSPQHGSENARLPQLKPLCLPFSFFGPLSICRKNSSNSRRVPNTNARPYQRASRTSDSDPRSLALSDRALPDYKGTGGPSFSLVRTRVRLFSVRSPLRFFKNRAS